MSLGNGRSSASNGHARTTGEQAALSTYHNGSSDLATLTAAPVEIEVGGQRLRATPLTLADYGEMDQAVLAGRPDPMARALAHCAGLSEPLQRALLTAAFDELVHGWPVTSQEVALWMHSREGMAHVLWLAVRTHQPQMTLTDCRELLRTDLQGREALRALDKIHGLPLGKPLGRARRPRPPATKRAASRGAKCFAG